MMWGEGKGREGMQNTLPLHVSLSIHIYKHLVYSVNLYLTR